MKKESNRELNKECFKYLNTDFGGKMRVGQLGRHKKRELGIIIQSFIPKFQLITLTDLNLFILQNGVKNLIYFLSNIFQ